MAQEQNISTQLNNLLVTRNFHPETLDRQGKPSDAAEAKTFTFDYVSGSGKNYGTMVVVLDSDDDMKVFYGDNLGRAMEGDDKDEFFDFQQQLSKFANAHRWTYTGTDLSQLKHTMQGLAAIQEGLFEGYYGTRKISYAGEPTEARLMIKHNRTLGEADARFRYVESLFIETADGERFKLPFKNLSGGRAMLEHVRQGGNPYDVRGVHIAEMVQEIGTLSRFNRASATRVMEGATQELITEARAYYKSLRENMKRMASPRGYRTYFETWHPATIDEQQELVENIKTLFIEQTLDTRIEAALPLLARIQQQGNAMKEAQIFENWANNLVEGTWNLPETPEQLNKLKELMATELVVGPDAINATEQLYDLVGDDELFDRLSELAAKDPRANAWNDTEVMNRLRELGIDLPEPTEPAAQEPALDAAAEMPAGEPEQAVAEDMSRRGFLRGLGAAALGAAGLGAAGTAQGKVTFDKDGNQINPPDWKNFQGTAPAQDAAPAAGSDQTIEFFKAQSAESRAAAAEAADAAAKIRYTNPKFREEYERIEKFYQQQKSIILNNRRPFSANVDLARRQYAESMKSLIAADKEFAQKTNALLKDYGALREQDVAESAELNTMLKYAGVPVAEGRMLDEAGETMDHILNRFKHEVDRFEAGEEMDSDLYYALFDYYSDHGEIPYGIAKGRDGDPFEWVTQRLVQDLGISEGWKGALAGGLAGGALGSVVPALGTLAGAAAGAYAGHKLGDEGFKDPDAAYKKAQAEKQKQQPVKEGSCNMTMEGEYCPEHGLMECGGMYEMGTVAGGMAPVVGEGHDDPINYNGAITGSYYESKESDSLLARIKSLANVNKLG